jgi:hypothetical protein
MPNTAMARRQERNSGAEVEKKPCDALKKETTPKISTLQATIPIWKGFHPQILLGQEKYEKDASKEEAMSADVAI